MSTAIDTTPRPADAELIARAAAVIPGGMYGHQSRSLLWPGAPQFFDRAEGSRIWDVAGNEYVDLMCSYGPILLGHRHPQVEEAVARQHRRFDCGNGPGPVMVDLAERLVGIVNGASWAMFAKNGSDVTTLALTIARASTGRQVILVAQGAYHGALPWCNLNQAGVLPSDRAHIAYYKYNDLDSVRQLASRHKGDLAGIIVSPFRHDAGFDQEDVNEDFAHGLRHICDQTGALLIMDEVRCGFRLAFGGSWDRLGVTPDLSAWGKAIGNGYPIAALTGTQHARAAAEAVFATGTFWFSADAMTAALATLSVIETRNCVDIMHRRGRELWVLLQNQAVRHCVPIRLTGHLTMPYLSFPGEEGYLLRDLFARECAARGVYLHPRHNWFISAALTERDMRLIADAMDSALEAVAKNPGR